MNQLTKDPYAVLGIDHLADQEEIKAAYNRAAMEHHPDRGGSSDLMAAVNWAYELLSDPIKRRHYDQFGNDPEQNLSLTPMQQDLLQLWTNLIAAEAFRPRKDFVALMKEAVKSKHAEHTKALGDFEKQIPRLKQLRERIHRKDGNVRTIFHSHIEQSIGACQRCIDDINAQIQMRVEQLQCLEDYGFNVEVPPDAGVAMLNQYMAGFGLGGTQPLEPHRGQGPRY